MTNLAAYRPHWHAVALSEAVTDQPRRATLLDENLVLFRTAAGVSVFRDLCIHRGAALSLGRVTDGVLECAYHGWQYDGQGACVRIPALPTDRPIPKKAHAIAHQAREFLGLVWVALEDPVSPFPAWPVGCTPDVPGLRAHVIGEYAWEVGAGRAIENFLDLAHLPFVHDGYLGDRSAPLVNEYDLVRRDFGLAFGYDQALPGDPDTVGEQKWHLDYEYQVPLTAHIKKTNARGEWSCISLVASPTTASTSTLFFTSTRNHNTDPAGDAAITQFVELINEQDKAVVSSVRPEQIPVDLREELHLKVPDAAGLEMRRYLARLERATAGSAA